MAESLQHIASGRTETVTLAPTISLETQEITTARLTLQKPKKDKKVNWREGTVDNEDMNKKKSKCCCIYKKPRSTLSDSSSDDEDMDCDGCRGHVEKKKKVGEPPDHQHDSSS